MWRELLPPWTTSRTPSTIEAINTPSVNELTGGESTTTCVKLFSSEASSFRIWSEPSNSAGFGGIGPELRIFRPVVSSRFTIANISSSLTSFARMELRPSSPGRLKIDCKRGRRISASMITTLAPVWARLSAVFTAVVVLPSPGKLEVTRSDFGARPAVESRTEVRKCL